MQSQRGQKRPVKMSQQELEQQEKAQRDAELMRKVDRHQARGNILAQMGRVLTKEDQDRAREEVLAHKF